MPSLCLHELNVYVPSDFASCVCVGGEGGREARHPCTPASTLYLLGGVGGWGVVKAISTLQGFLAWRKGGDEKLGAKPKRRDARARPGSTVERLGKVSREES